MQTKQFTIEKLKKIGNSKNPSYAIVIPKHFTKEGIATDKRTSIIMTQEEEQ